MESVGNVVMGKIPGLRAVDLYHSFEDNGVKNTVLKGVSLDIKPGEITSVVGPSGCGKSTLLYLLGLLDQPEGGEIFMGDIPVHQFTDQERTRTRNEAIGFVFQFHFLIKELTALENVRLPLLRSKADRGFADEKAEDLLRELGLADKLSRPAFKLSGGEQQRVAIARALANSPRYLLADEPTGNLDSANSEAVFELLQETTRKTDLAVVLVTHNQKLADLSDCTYSMLDGRIFT